MLRFLILGALCGWSFGFGAIPPMPDHRIVVGVYTTIVAHPHQVSIQEGGGHYCGGSIINPSWVITAASYIGSYASAYTVSVGSAHISGGKKYSVKRVVRHPGFNVNDYDIALLEDEGPISTQLRQVSVPIVDRKDCANASMKNVTPRMICTGVDEGGKGPCLSDGGGPLSANDVLYGIVSWSTGGCGRPEYPSVYSNVASLRS